ncbi:hypothetical protein G3480_21955 [Thiorhodococcus mannitoliphagus]|uniref:Type II toxin-antitoxin system PemK/MazF family toxin n=1 Tax=Thiorhodococcus mannitoliphagus TaxID=329406 RepID=A0A6P1E119_9GAMM|nr:hypothetical protein [Thiorhodococcus mannitoliphagus]NEX22933.1 hypothetical protein [Thiorhodococcus mannitoliphagus]
MFTGRPLPPLPPVVTEANWAAGFVHNCRQSLLLFGSNRSIPVPRRPVVEVRADGVRIVVLPCTSKTQSINLEFFELTPERIHWTRADAPRSYAFYRYETVPANALIGKKIGTMTHPARIDLMNWLKERY